MTKEEGQSPVVMLNSFQHLIRFSLPLADTPFIPVHRTGFSGAISNKFQCSNDQNNFVWDLVLVIWCFLFFLGIKDLNHPISEINGLGCEEYDHFVLLQNECVAFLFAQLFDHLLETQ